MQRIPCTTSQLARSKQGARAFGAIWHIARHLDDAPSLSYSAIQSESAAYYNLIVSYLSSLRVTSNKFSVEVSAQHTLLWAFLFVSLILSLHLIISNTSNRLSSISFRVMGYLSSV